MARKVVCYHGWARCFFCWPGLGHPAKTCRWRRRCAACGGKIERNRPSTCRRCAVLGATAPSLF